MSTIPQPQNNRVVSFGNRIFAAFALEHNVHCIPVDEAEEQRQLQLHNILREIFDGTVIPPVDFPPDGVDEPAVLDCGFGKGAWIDDLLSEYEDAVVTGVDTFLGRGSEQDDEDDDADNEDDDDDDVDEVQEFERKQWNLNAPFRDDRSETRLQPGSFHLINSRFLVAGINGDRWPTYIADLKRLLKPGGWLQMVEQYALVRSENGQAVPYLQRWWQMFSAALAQMNKNAHVGRSLRTHMNNQGFESVHERAERLPIGNWDARHASLGEEILDSVDKMLTAVTLYPFLRPSRPLMTRDEYLELLQGARRELRTPALRLYYTVYCVVGQRPRLG